MKHTLNVLTLTALAAAASAQTAAAAPGLNYNTVGISRTSRQNAVAVQGLLGSSNILVGIQSTNDTIDSSEPTITVGYVFRGVTNGIDATVSVQQPQWEETVYSLSLRRAINEIYAGLEVSVGYSSTLNSGESSYIAVGGTSAWSESAVSYEVSYNVNKTISVAVGQVHFSRDNLDRQTVFSVRAGF